MSELSAQQVASNPPPNVFASPEVSNTAAVLLLEFHGSWYHYYCYDLNTNQLRLGHICGIVHVLVWGWPSL